MNSGFIQPESYETYLELYNKARQESDLTYGNIYLFPDEIKRYISLGRLYIYKLSQKGFMVFSDEENYYQLHAMLCDETPVDFIRAGIESRESKDKPVISRIIDRQSGQDRRSQQDWQDRRSQQDQQETQSRRSQQSVNTELFRDKLISAGFKLRDITLEMRIKPDENREDIKQNLERALKFIGKRGLSAQTADKNCYDKMMKLRDSSLDPLHFRFEAKEEIERELEAGHFQTITDAEGNICATHRFEIIGGYAIGHVIAVAEPYRRLGLGPVLVYRFLNTLIEQGIKSCLCWVISDNEPSLQMHGRIGFKLTGKKSEQLYFS